MENIVIDTSVIKRSKELKVEIGFDFLSKLTSFSKVAVPVSVNEEMVAMGLSLGKIDVKEADYDKTIWNEFKIESNKNLGEAECVKLCLNDESSIFLTEDYKAWKVGEKFLGERSTYFLFALPEFYFLTKKEKLEILTARNKVRKIARKTYEIIKGKIESRE